MTEALNVSYMVLHISDAPCVGVERRRTVGFLSGIKMDDVLYIRLNAVTILAAHALESHGALLSLR